MNKSKILQNYKQHLLSSIIRTKKRNAYHYKKIQTLGFNIERINTKVSIKDSKDKLADVWIELSKENLKFNSILIDYKL